MVRNGLAKPKVAETRSRRLAGAAVCAAGHRGAPSRNAASIWPHPTEERVFALGWRIADAPVSMASVRLIRYGSGPLYIARVTSRRHVNLGLSAWPVISLGRGAQMLTNDLLFLFSFLCVFSSWLFRVCRSLCGVYAVF